MVIEQLYTKCLAQGAYYIESEGEVAIIDPLREVGSYIQLAKEAGAKIKYIFETHFHADFVSGHVTLSEMSGAPIIYGPSAKPAFEALIASDGQEFKLGRLTIKAIHTPGHTLESTCYLLTDENGVDHSIFTGDTLFLGDVGRPDLAQKSDEITQEQLAEILFDSLRTKIMPLGDQIMVYPAHGAGSSCGKNMMKETMDTLGNQKKVNYALRADMTKEEFVAEVLDGLAPPPAYFPLNAQLNKKGYLSLQTVLKQGHQALSPKDFKTTSEKDDIKVLDVRHQFDFVKEHIPGSLFIGLNGTFAPWVGAILKDVRQKLLLVVDEGKIDEAITRLARVGFDQTIGFLEGGLSAWKAADLPVESVDCIEPNAFAALSQMDDKLSMVDVRKPSEYTTAHVLGATNYPLTTIEVKFPNSSKDKNLQIYCAGGYRSVIAISILKAQGFTNLTNVNEGFDGIKNTDTKIVHS